MKVGDLVCDITDIDAGVGIVIAVIKNVEIPPLVEILWDNGYICKVYQDDLKVLSESR
tara:strand:+ start:532 stop:705 length:174 start_codon:yes stop_codon:yes gene_type:complete